MDVTLQESGWPRIDPDAAVGNFRGMGDPKVRISIAFLPIPAHKVRMPTDEQDHSPFNSLWIELDEFVRMLQLNVTQLRELKSQKDEARSVLKNMRLHAENALVSMDELERLLS